MKRLHFLLILVFMLTALAGLYAQAVSEPLILPEWHQTSPWNRNCPGQGQNRAHAGSHALAMAKTMKYWQHPSSGTGSVSYVDDDFGAINQNFAAEINWDGMSNTLVFQTTQRFIFACGAATYTDYEYDYSGSSLANIRNALINNFIYEDDMQIESRQNYGNFFWKSMIRAELDSSRPVIYAVQMANGDEVAFILDAYNDDGLFHANFSSADYPNTWVDLNSLVVWGEAIADAQQSMLIGILPSMGPDTISENFEDGFGNHNWQFSGNANWTVSSEAAYFGSNSAKSGNIDNNQSTSMYIVIDVSESADISFYKKVSCESEANDLYDHLAFFIDDVEQERWSGDGQWEYHEYPVSPGVHEFRWTYSKDGATVYYSDCAWVDAITFPPGITPLMPPRFVEAEQSGDRDVLLSWMPPEITQGLVGFKIFRNSTEIAQFNNPQMSSYTDYDLPNGAYDYHLRAVYGTGLSNPSNVSSVTIEVPYAPENLLAEVSGFSDVNLSWEAPPVIRDRALLGYYIYRDNQILAAVENPGTLTYEDPDLDEGIYYYQVSALYSSGESPRSNVAQAALGVPEPPANLQATVQGANVNLSWEQVQNTAILLGFKVFRDSQQIALINDPDQLTYNDQNLPNGSYAYFLRAVYQGGDSGNSATVFADVEVPYPPVNLMGTVAGSSVQLSWENPLAGRALTHYYVYRNSQVIAAVFNPSVTNYIDSGLPNGDYQYYVTAFYSGQESAPSNTVTIYLEELYPPYNLNAELSANDISLSWASPINPRRDLLGFRIWRNEELLEELLSDDQYTDSDLPNGNYSYEVAAVYNSGVSPAVASEIINVQYAPAPLNLEADSIEGMQIELSWQPPVDSALPDSYRVYRDEIMIASVTQTGYIDGDVELAEYYTYYVTALYGELESPASNQVTIYASFTPQTPSLSGEVLGSSVHLVVDPGYIPAGVEYEIQIQRNLDPAFILFNTTTYTDSDLPNGVYNYSAWTVIGTELPYVTEPSNTYTATIDLVQSPQNLTAFAEANDAHLNWQAVYSPLRPVSYRVYRDSALIAETEDNSFIDEDLPNGNYSYYVSAMFAEEESLPSNTVSLFIELYYPPTDLTYQINERDVSLSWQAPNLQGRAFLGYRIWRDENVIQELHTDTNYLDSGLANGSYQYMVASVYSDGISEPTAPVQILISHSPAPQNLSAALFDFRVVELTWDAPADVFAPEAYRLYRNGTYYTESDGNTYTDMPDESGIYSYYVTALNGGVESVASNTIQIEVNLNPSSVLLQGSVSADEVQLSWTVENAPAAALIHYEVYRDAALLAETESAAYTDSNLDNGEYEYTVRAVYDWITPYTTDYSNSFSAAIDVVYPPQDLQYSLVENDLSLSWSAVYSAFRPVSYNIYRNGEAIGNTSQTSFMDGGLANGSYTYYVSSLFAGEESLAGPSISFTLDIPYAPTNLNAQVQEDDVILSWELPPTGQDRALSGYYIYRNGSLHQSLSNPAQLSFSDSGVSNGSYSYYVVALYGSQVSLPSNTVMVEVYVAPNLPAPQNLSAVLQGERDVILSWEAPEVSPTQYIIFRNGNEIGNSVSPGFTDAFLPNGSYQYYVKAEYPLGISSSSNTAQINIMYAYPPLDLNAEILNQNNLNLTWIAPAQGEMAYLIFVNDIEIAYIADPQTTNYLIEDLPNGQYAIYMKAVYPDAISNPGNAVTLSIEIPYTPQGFELASAERDAVLSWNALSDSYGFLNYIIYRNGSQYQSTTETSFSDVALPNGDYSYQISAMYSFGESPFSETLNATIQIAESAQNLQAVVNTNEIALSWDPPADTGYFTQYLVYQNDIQIEQTTLTALNIENLPNGNYQFHVIASYSFDDSDPSNIVSAIIAVPYSPTNLNAVATQNTVDLSWQAIPSFGQTPEFQTYKLYRDDELIATTDGLTFSDTDLPNGTYLYEISAQYIFGESEPISTSVEVFTALPPTNLSLAYYPPNGATLGWSRPQIGETGFRLYRNDIMIAELPGDVQIYNDSNLPNGNHSYHVSAMYGDIESPLSNAVIAHIVFPYEPYDLSVSQLDAQIYLSWSTPDAGLLDHYNIYRNEELIGTSVLPEFYHPIIANGTYYYYVIAVYEDDVISAPSNFASTTIQLSYSPSGLTADVSTNDISLSWQASSDIGGLLYYRLYRDNTQIYQGGSLSFADTDLANGEYSYRVSAVYDLAGESASSNVVDATIEVAYPPQNLDYYTEQNTVGLAWDYPTDTTYFEYFRVYRDGALIETTTNNIFTDPALANAAYEYTVTSVYEFGESEPGPTLLILIQLTYPPQNLQANLDGNNVILNWNAPEDTGFLEHYNVYRNDEMIGWTQAIVFSNTTLPPGTYEYRITAAYTFGESESSNTVEVQIVNLIVPQNLQASSVENSVQLSWENVPTSVQFQHYKVYRNNLEIGTSSVNSFVDEELPNGSYSYQVSTVYTQGESGLSQSTEIDHIMPYPPLDVAIEVLRNVVNVSWYSPVDTGFLTGFRVYRNGDAIGDIPFEASRRAQFSFDDSIFQPGLYSYRVASIYGGIFSESVSPVNPEEETIEILWPYIPQNITVQQIDSGLQLSWDDVPEDADFMNYNIYLNGELYSTSLQPQATLTELANGNYNLRVSTLYTQAESPLSEEVSASLINAHVPQNFSANVVERNSVSLSWQTPSDAFGFSSFELYRGNTLLVSDTATAYLDEALPNGSYTYRLLSRYGDDVSSYLSLNVLVADIAPVQNVLAETVADGYRISFSAPDLFHAPDFYDVYFIPTYPNTPQSDWIFVARTNTAEAVVDSLHGGFEHGNFTWAVICKWQSISSVSIAYSNSIFVEMIPQYNYLAGNYPNPFNPDTNIVFWLKEDSPVRLKIYNIRGQLVRKLFSGDMQKGIKSLSFDGRDDAGNALASGTYIYHLNAGSYQRTRQMTLSK